MKGGTSWKRGGGGAGVGARAVASSGPLGSSSGPVSILPTTFLISMDMAGHGGPCT